MNCETAREQFSLYIDKMLPKAEEIALREHIDGCESCRSEFFLLLEMVNTLGHLEEAEMPVDLHQHIMDQIEKQQDAEQTVMPLEKERRKPFYKRRFFYGSAAAVFLLLVVTVVALQGMGRKNANENWATGVGSSANSTTASPPRSESAIAPQAAPQEYSVTADMRYDLGAYEEAERPMMEGADDAYTGSATDVTTLQSKTSVGGETTGTTSSAAQQNRKIIRNASIEMEVTSYDHAVNVIQSQAEASGGYVESSNSYIYSTYWLEDGKQEVKLKRGNITIRVPAGAYYDIKNSLETLGEVINNNESSQEVTAQYIDVEARMKVKKEEEARLLDIMRKATEVEDLIALERQLSMIRTEVETYQATLNNLDRLTQFSTINLSLWEEYPEQMNAKIVKTFTERLSEGAAYSLESFQYGVEGLVISLARNMIQLFVTVVVLIAAIAIALKIWKVKRMKKNEGGKNL